MDTDRQRYVIGPDLTAVLDEAGCLVLEVHEPGRPAQVLRRVTVTNLEYLVDRLFTLRELRDAAEREAEAERREGLEEVMVLREMLADGKRPGEAPTSMAAAYEALIAAGLFPKAIRYLIRRAYGHQGATFNVEGTEQLGTVTYDREAGTYAVRVPERRAGPS